MLSVFFFCHAAINCLHRKKAVALVRFCLICIQSVLQYYLPPISYYGSTDLLTQAKTMFKEKKNIEVSTHLQLSHVADC